MSVGNRSSGPIPTAARLEMRGGKTVLMAVIQTRCSLARHCFVQMHPLPVQFSKPLKSNSFIQGLFWRPWKNGCWTRKRVGIRGVMEQVVQRLPVASVQSVIAAGIAFAAASSKVGASSHAAVTSTLTHVAITAFAIASGACLSTKVDCLWPRENQRPDSVILEGVDITGYTIFNEAKVQKAIMFARTAHNGQMRKTGEPYLTHCIHTGKIISALVPSSGQRAANTVVAGILHDVIDDASEDLRNIEKEFGDDVARLVAGVSKLSYINQLLRRHRRTNADQDESENGSLGPAEVDNLHVMLLGMVNDPRVVLIKLADRLHNMRTIYALPPSKARAVAQETLAIWCSLASRLGVWAIKAELEDLCFAVLQPQVFHNLRAELAAMWKPSKEKRDLRRITERARRRSTHNKKVDFKLEKIGTTEEEELIVKQLLQAVVPFDLLLDRGKRSRILSSFAKYANWGKGKPKVVRDAEIALASLAACEEALEKEIFISTSYIPGMEVTLCGRLKSLYSTHCKMKRKGVGVRQIYDARALRVVVGDGGGKFHAAAVECCYSLLNVVHRLWTPIDGEFDDYIVNPKPSGYQSLHTAVQGPDGSPLEVQIRTQCMHEYAEYGHAAHWLYKESGNVARSITLLSNVNPTISLNGADSTESKPISQVTEQVESQMHPKLKSIRVGHPVLRVEDSRLLAAVVVSVDNGGRELLVAVSFALGACEAVAAGRSGNQTRRWEAYANLFKKISSQRWFAPGHGDWNTCLEKYTLCRDGLYHKQDQFQRSLPTFIQLIDLNEEEEEKYWEVISAILEGKEVDASLLVSNCSEKLTNGDSFSAASTVTHLNDKVRLLRAMLQWEEQLRHTAAVGIANALTPGHPNSVMLAEVAIIRWPDGVIMRMQFGSTAADAARRLGLDGKLVFVNGQLALPHTQLKNGDIIEVRV